MLRLLLVRSDARATEGHDTMTQTTLTTEERAALDAYAAMYGRNWKDALRSAWLRASEPGILQALRNSPRFGPRGLVLYRPTNRPDL